MPGGRGLRIDLSQEIPLRGELAAHVEVSRGRLGVYAVDSFDELGEGKAGIDWPAPQLPGQELTLLGLPHGEGTRALVLANDGDDEVRATVRVVTKDSAFRPTGLDEVRVPPGSVTRVPLSAILGTAVEDGALGVQVEANHPVTATLRSFVDGDLSHAVPLPAVTDATQAIVPELGPRATGTVLLTSNTVGSAEVLARLSGGGKKVIAVDLAPGRTASVELPPKTVLVQVTPSGTSVLGAIVVEDGGGTVIGLHELVRTGLVPRRRHRPAVTSPPSTVLSRSRGSPCGRSRYLFAPPLRFGACPARLDIVSFAPPRVRAPLVRLSGIASSAHPRSDRCRTRWPRRTSHLGSVGYRQASRWSSPRAPASACRDPVTCVAVSG